MLQTGLIYTDLDACKNRVITFDSFLDSFLAHTGVFFATEPTEREQRF